MTITIAIHGGAGTIRRTDLSPEKEAAIITGLNAAGNVAMPFNCEDMYRAMVDGSGRRVVAIYRDQDPLTRA